ncbi:DNA excision repair protein ERCC-6-like 2 isoform X4 [Acropora millepora]|uniref:DNA excision repair protein ERCC-6-like 2 isoform X4 n=1 Tax=Acropora millepora TaxID=45264 RepID=UPI001CF3E609|nr:DNA excision repair protein ERCC-6-like 2 isoform X4 [Acropora millepora]
MLQRIRMNCNDSTSDYDKATEEEKKKKSVDFDCESGVHNRGKKSKWHLFENCFVDSLESQDELSTKEKLYVSTWKKGTLASGEKCSGASKEHTVMSSENNRQRHCQPAAESEMALAVKSHHSSGEVIHDHENNDNEEEFDDNLIFADGFDDQDMERPSFTQPSQHPTIPMVLSEPGVKPVIQIPATINRYLRDYQRDGVHFLYQHFSKNTGAILGDDMGLGKTVQVIAFIAAVLGKTGTKADVFYQFMDGKRAGKQRDSICKVSGTFLIVSPGSVMYNWKEELETWGHFKMGLFHGNTKEDTLQRTLRGRLDVALTTYETMRNHLDDVNKVQWLAVIMDEVHRLKDPKSQITVAAKALRAKRRYGLTGTPLQNKLEEFWCVLDWANPGSLGKSKTFTREFDKPIREGQTYDATKRELALSRKKSKDLQDMIRKFFLRRTKDLIANQLPHKDELVVFCPLTSFQEDVYQTLLQNSDVELITKKNFPCDCGSGVDRGKCCYKFSSDNEDIKTVTMRYFQLLLKVGNHAALLAPTVKQTLDQRERAKDLCLQVFARYPEFSSCSDLSSFEVLSNPKYCGKMKVLDKLLRMFRREHCKVLLFSRSTQLLNILEEFVVSQGLVYSRLDGGTKPSERTRLVRDFNLDPNIFLSLVSTKAGGLGLNFTGANVVVIFDPDWNPSSDLQAQDRAYRIGQRRDVRVYRLISSGTIEEMIYLRQVYKQQLANVAIKGTNERRYFTGIEGDRKRKGELFGLENLFSYRAEGASLSKDIVNRTEKLEAGYEVAKYQIAHEKMREDSTLNQTTGDGGVCQKNDKDPYNLEEMASQFIDDEELPASRLNKMVDEPWKNINNTADTRAKGKDTSSVVNNNAASWSEGEDLLCQKRSVLANNSKGMDLLQNKLPSVEDFFISEDDVMEPEIAVSNQKSAEKIPCPDTGEPASVIPLTAENGSSSFNLRNKLNSSNIKGYTKVKGKRRNIRREESVDCVPSAFTFNHCVVEDSCSEHSVMNKAVASEISSCSENEESSEGLFSMRSRVRPKRKTKTSFSERSKILKEGHNRVRRFPGKRVTNKSVNEKCPAVKQSKSINTVEEIFESCGVRYTHANRHVVGPSKAEDHMSKQALKDVFELKQFSQQPANCLPTLETSDESDDLGETSWGNKQQEEKAEDVTITLNRFQEALAATLVLHFKVAKL